MSEIADVNELVSAFFSAMYDNEFNRESGRIIARRGDTPTPLDSKTRKKLSIKEKQKIVHDNTLQLVVSPSIKSERNFSVAFKRNV